MTTQITDFKKFYTVQKTITFELKSDHQYKYKGEIINDVDFKKTSNFVNENYFKKVVESSDGIEELKKLLKFGDNLIIFIDEFCEGIIQNFFDKRCFQVKKELKQIQYIQLRQ